MANEHIDPTDAIAIAQALVRCKSVTPADDGALDIIDDILSEAGFRVERLVFESEGSAPIDNLYARFGDSAPNLCFAGHTDVVPVGNVDAWSHDPFDAHIEDGNLFGRGTADMKGAIAAWISAAVAQVKSREVKGSLSFLITGDEEGPAVNGTIKMLQHLKAAGETIDYCVVGEPTCPEVIGDMIKVGRRGSLNVRLRINGHQGHVAYPHLADNPTPKMIELLSHLKQGALDEGTEWFQPSNLEVTSLTTNTNVHNVIPGYAEALINIRYSTLHTFDSLEKDIVTQLDKANLAYEIEFMRKGEAFLNAEGKLSAVLHDAVKKHTGQTAKFSTTGGTSDARFIKDYAEVVEFGLVGQTMHSVNEHVAVEDIKTLREIYASVIAAFQSG